MNTCIRILVCAAATTLIGCAHAPVKRLTPVSAYVAPSIISVATPIQATRDALSRARLSSSTQDWPAVTMSIDTADQNAAKAQIALLAYQAQVEGLTSQLNKAISDRNAALLERDEAQILIKKQAAEIHQLAKERDIIPYIVAVCVGLWFITLADAIPITAQYRFWAKLVSFAVGFGSGYGAGRLLVRSIATFLP